MLYTHPCFSTFVSASTSNVGGIKSGANCEAIEFIVSVFIASVMQKAP